MYTVVIRHQNRRDENIQFPRDSTSQEIIDAATLYSRGNLVDVYHDDAHVATALNGRLATFAGTALDAFINTRQTALNLETPDPTPAPTEDAVMSVDEYLNAPDDVHITGLSFPNIAKAASVAALSLALLTSQHAAAQTVPPDTYTAGCSQVDVTGEGFPIMYCPEDGATYYIDMDGQPYENAAGYPVYAPGAWIEMP